MTYTLTVLQKGWHHNPQDVTVTADFYECESYEIRDGVLIMQDVMPINPVVRATRAPMVAVALCPGAIVELWAR